MTSPSMEWLVEDYLDGSSSIPVVVPATDLGSDFAEFGSQMIQQQHHCQPLQEEPLSPVYVKQQQQQQQQRRDDDTTYLKNRGSPLQTQRPIDGTATDTPDTPKASNALIKTYDDVRDQQRKQLTKREKLLDASTHSVVSCLSSSVGSNRVVDAAIRPRTTKMSSLSTVLSEVTEDEVTHHDHSTQQSQRTATQETNDSLHVQKHSILQLCTEDLLSDNAQRVALALEHLPKVCGEGIQFTQVGGHGILIGVMKKYPSNARILGAACTLVQTLVSSSSPPEISVKADDQHCGFCNAFAELFLAVNGLDLLLKLMEVDSVRPQAARALTQLLRITSMERLLQTKHAQTYLRIVREHRVSTNGMLCRLLYQLSTKENDATLIQETTVDLIVAELNDCPDSRSVQVYGCATLGNIFKKAPEFGHNGIPAILRAMKLFGNDEIVLERAVTGLLYCCRIPHQIDMFKQGGLSTISLAMECFPQNAIIQSRGSAIIKALLSSSSSSSHRTAGRIAGNGRCKS